MKIKTLVFQHWLNQEITWQKQQNHLKHLNQVQIKYKSNDPGSHNHQTIQPFSRIYSEFYMTCQIHKQNKQNDRHKNVCMNGKKRVEGRRSTSGGKKCWRGLESERGLKCGSSSWLPKVATLALVLFYYFLWENLLIYYLYEYFVFFHLYKSLKESLILNI